MGDIREDLDVLIGDECGQKEDVLENLIGRVGVVP
jgi:hypothetical protein